MSFIKRTLAKRIKRSAQFAPVVAILGPRQAGKTTLARTIFKKYTYVSLDEMGTRQQVLDDPRGFLEKHVEPCGLIIDEAQRIPHLFSYIMLYVDEHQKSGRIVLICSQNYLLMRSVTQSLAGRIALHTLLPLSIAELKQAKLLATTPEQAMIKGFYPRIFAQKIEPSRWYPGYTDTYLERDIRLIQNVTDLEAFHRFTRLCAGRIGQILNLTSLANDCGISVNTAKAWLSLLQTSYIIFLLHPHYKNFNKRLIKSPKLYFYDTGLACSLLSIQSADELNHHYLRGNLFEGMVIADIIKEQYNRGGRPSCYFWRDHTGNEIDCIIEKGPSLYPIEIKASLTINEHFFSGLNFWNTIAKAAPKNSFVVYGDKRELTWRETNVVSWQSCDEIVAKTLRAPRRTKIN